MSDQLKNDHELGIDPLSTPSDMSSNTKADRRKVLKLMGAASAGVAAPGFGATYLRGFEYTRSVQAQGNSPVKVGFIEDESGNLSVYGIQKLHAAQLAVKEINEGKTLKGGPDIGAGGLGALGSVAKNPPTVSKEGVGLDIVNAGGEKSTTEVVFDEDADVFVDSGDKGILGREVSLVSVDGQSNNALWQQLARRLIQQDKVDVLVAGFASAEREAIRPIVDQFKQLYFYTNQYEGGVADANTFCTGPVCEQQVIPVVQYMVEKFGPRGYTLAADYNFGQLTAAWTKAFAPLVGGQIIAEEFVPLSVSEYRARATGQTGLGDDSARRPEPAKLLSAGRRRRIEVPDGFDRQHGTGLRAQALQAAIARQHAQRYPVPARSPNGAQSRVR
jgi:urea transport system substrate-binding protein